MDAVFFLILAACLLGCTAAACHAALKTFSRRRLTEMLEEAGKPRLAERLIDQLDALLLMTGVVRTAAGIVIAFGVLYEVKLIGWFDETQLAYYAVAFAIAALLLSVFIVAIPVSWARYGRESLLCYAAPTLLVLATAFAPVAALLHLFDPLVRRISGVDLINGEDNDLSDDVLDAIEQHDDADEIDQTQRDMVEDIIELGDRSAAEIMTPRTDIEGIEVDASLMDVRKAVLDFGHSRIPVYEESLDQIVGILYVRDLVRFVGGDEDFHLRQLLRDPFLVPESKPALDLLAEFKQLKVHMAIVVDEYGGTAGLITIEDILEEIVGEIQDEYEEGEVEPTITDVAEGVWELDARVEIPDLEDRLDIDLPEDRDYDTVGGLVIAGLGRIPEVGDAFDCEGHRVTVTAAERTRVTKVRIEKLVEQAEAMNGE